MRQEMDAPGFPGFYETIFNDVWPEARDKVAGEYASRLSDIFEDKYGIGLEFDRVYSPSQYNYTTDACVCSCDLSEEQVDKLIDSESFENYIKEINSSPGYASFCPKTKEDFLKEFEAVDTHLPLNQYVCDYLMWRDNKGLADDISMDVFYDFMDEDPYVFDDKFWEDREDIDTAIESLSEHMKTEMIERAGELEEKPEQYICFGNKDNDDFHIGDTKTADGWRLWALNTADDLEMSGEKKLEHIRKLDELEGDDLVAYIGESTGGLDIMSFDEYCKVSDPSILSPNNKNSFHSVDDFYKINIEKPVSECDKGLLVEIYNDVRTALIAEDLGRKFYPDQLSLSECWSIAENTVYDIEQSGEQISMSQAKAIAVGEVRHDIAMKKNEGVTDRNKAVASISGKTRQSESGQKEKEVSNSVKQVKTGKER